MTFVKCSLCKITNDLNKVDYVFIKSRPICEFCMDEIEEEAEGAEPKKGKKGLTDEDLFDIMLDIEDDWSSNDD